jgi:hypothetical protein
MWTTFRNCRRGLAAIAFALAMASPAAAQEGIKVIGEWTIVVRDEAGNVVQRSDFRNALLGQGKPTLAGLLSRGQQISEWLILLANSSTGTPPCGTPADRKNCGLVERISSQLPFTQSVDYVPSLTVDLDPADSSRVRLQGSMKATGSGPINNVQTMLSVCPPGPPSPTGCPTTQTFAYFSGTTNFTNPPSVVQGQTIDVTVTFSFQ